MQNTKYMFVLNKMRKKMIWDNLWLLCMKRSSQIQQVEFASPTSGRLLWRQILSIQKSLLLPTSTTEDLPMCKLKPVHVMERDAVKNCNFRPFEM